MPRSSTSNSDASPAAGTWTVPFGSNAVRLTWREWVIVAVIVATVFTITPGVWEGVELFKPGEDYRQPFALSNDYWTYERMIEHAVSTDGILLLGDSVIWGEYVTPGQTLSQHLNQRADRPRFVNGGLNGVHPLALWGLVEHYAGGIRNRKVILHGNLLWMSSLERDLWLDKVDIQFNHPDLVPQFSLPIPSYKAKVSDRMGRMIDRAFAYRGWVNHIRVAHFDGQDVPGWTREHPYRNPFAQIEPRIRAPQNQPHSKPISWTERGIQPQDIPWIGLNSSLQWEAFREIVRLLQSRGNDVFVLVGPFNEHMLKDTSRERYQAIKQLVADWLRDESIPSFVPEPLPSEECGDASHPLADGYRRLAEQLWNRSEFQEWMERTISSDNR